MERRFQAAKQIVESNGYKVTPSIAGCYTIRHSDNSVFIAALSKKEFVELAENEASFQKILSIRHISLTNKKGRH